MKRSDTKLCLIAVISLLLSVIWHSSAIAAVAPSLAPLGRISQEMSAPGRIDVDAAGNLYVADARARAVLKYDKFGQLVKSFSGVPVSGGGVAVTPDGARLYAAGRDVVTVLDGVTGATVGHLGAGAGEFQYVGEIDLDAAGYVFVADAGAKLIKVYDAGGNFQYEFGGLGIEPGQFWTIWAMSVDALAGEVYVADIATYGTSVPKVQVFDLAGNLRRSMDASTAFGSLTIGFFGGMTFDQEGRGYFLDSFRGNLRVIGLPSTALSMFGEAGFGAGQLQGPQDVAYDPQTKRLFVSCDGARVEIFGVDGGQNPVHANKKPGMPVPVDPVADSEVDSASPELLFQSAVDPDGDQLSYDVQVLGEGAVVAEYVGLPGGEATTSVRLDVTLEENARYQWAVQAADGEDVSGWTELQSFYVNAEQEAPAVPVVDAPEGGVVLDGAGLFSWQSSTDPDPFDTISYVVEVAADASFAQVVCEEAVTGTSILLSQFAGYDSLEDGAAYFWRIKAVDNHGLVSGTSPAREFSYDTTVLSVSANMPGAKVYVGGNNAYAGRYVGEAPLELRDFPVGPVSVVVERAGFEPFVAQVRPQVQENVNVYAALSPAVAPADLKARPLQADGVDIRLVGDSAPFAVDFDNDGLVDLLVGDASGGLTLYRGMMLDGVTMAFSAGVSLDVPQVPGAAPFVADWDNDGWKDILVGGADGTVTLFLNRGSEDAPAFGEGELLKAAGVPINVGSAAVPAVVDLDGDGAKDLVVGATQFLNGGTDASPQLVAAGRLAALPGSVAPFFADWDGDGVRELLLAASEHLYRYVKVDGVYSPVEVLSVASDLLGGAGQSAKGAFSLGELLRLNVVDFDGAKGKDLIVGNAAGEVRLVSSHGSEFVSAFGGALLDKVSQIDQMAPELAEPLAAISAAIEQGDLKDAGKLVKDLESGLLPGTELATVVGELAALL